MSDLVDRIAEQLAEDRYTGYEWGGCNGSRWERLPESVQRRLIDQERFAAESAAAYFREHFTDHAEELGLTRHKHYMSVPDDTRTECACGSGNQPTRQVPAHRYMTELVPDE